jgi:hypothetical protein
LTPGDADARRNLAVALNRKHNPPPPKKDKQDQKKNPDKPKDEPQKNQDKSGGGKTGQTKTRPQDSMSREDADRVMRAVADREKGARKQAAPASAYGQKRPPKAPTEEDW